MPADDGDQKDTRFGVYIDPPSLRNYREICNDIGINYSKAARRLIDRFSQSDDVVRRWFLGHQSVDVEKLAAAFADVIKSIRDDDTGSSPIPMPKQPDAPAGGGDARKVAEKQRDKGTTERRTVKSPTELMKEIKKDRRGGK